MWGDTYLDYYYDEGCAQFDYYRINTAASYKIKQYNGSNQWYWGRSPRKNIANAFIQVANDGTFDHGSASASWLGVAFDIAL